MVNINIIKNANIFLKWIEKYLIKSTNLSLNELNEYDHLSDLKNI